MGHLFWGLPLPPPHLSRQLPLPDRGGSRAVGPRWSLLAYPIQLPEAPGQPEPGKVGEQSLRNTPLVTREGLTQRFLAWGQGRSPHPGLGLITPFT